MVRTQKLIEDTEKEKAQGANFRDIISRNAQIRDQIKDIEAKMKEMDRLQKKELAKKVQSRKQIRPQAANLVRYPVLAPITPVLWMLLHVI
jgi:hypothetical protein